VGVWVIVFQIRTNVTTKDATRLFLSLAKKKLFGVPCRAAPSVRLVERIGRLQHVFHIFHFCHIPGNQCIDIGINRSGRKK
jgi:hypothetical protein